MSFALVFALMLAACLAEPQIVITHLNGTAVAPAPRSKFECTVCLNFMQDSLQNLIEIIANVGIGGGCAKVCGYLPSHAAAAICDLICEIKGIEEFEKLLNEEDPDPIYICEKVDLCPHSTTAAANVTSLAVSPQSGPQGTQFAINFVFQVTNTIATGELAVVVVPPQASSFGGSNLIYELAPGSYSGSMTFEATPNEQEPFNPGSYQVRACSWFLGLALLTACA